MGFARGISNSIGVALRACAVSLVIGGLLVGCANRSPHRQEFVELRTPHFAITSSYSEADTLAFARSLELFHAGVGSLLGLTDPGPAATPARVYVFDDRSLGRPFAVQNEAAFLLDEVDAPILVFRGGRDFAARATPELRHRHAQRVLRDHSPVERPLWFEEGVAQLARSVTETTNGVRLGRIVPEYKQTVLDWKREELVSVLTRFDLSDATPAERERFSAQAWAVAHTLEFSDSPASGTHTLLDAYRRSLDSPEAAQRERAFDAIGLSTDELAKRIYSHLETPRPKVRLLEFRGLDTGRWRPTPLSRAESRVRLGQLALRLERPELALEHFELALKDHAKHPAARIGRATAAAMLGRFEVVDATFESLELLPDAPAELQIATGDAFRAVAAKSDSPEQRRLAVAVARQRYEDALRGPAPAARAQLGMALIHLEVEGEDPAEAIRWLEAARKTSAGSLTLDLWVARAEARSGSERLAGIRARNVLSRTHDLALRKQARALLESLGDVGD